MTKLVIRNKNIINNIYSLKYQILFNSVVITWIIIVSELIFNVYQLSI